MRDLLLAMERLLVAAAHRELSAGEIPEVIAVPPATRGPSWLRCRGGWFDVEATREVWRDVAGPDAMLFAAPGDGGHTILGYYCGSREPAALHRAFVAAVAGRSDVRAPDRYVRCRAAPGDVSDRGAWESMGRGAVTTRRLDRAGGC
jgi:hypothetical protein